MREESSRRYRCAMAPQAATTFFVESYVPGLDQAAAAALTSRLRVAVAELQREGRPIAWVRSFALVDEETFVWMLRAADAGDIARVNQRARVSSDTLRGPLLITYETIERDTPAWRATSSCVTILL